MEQHEEPECPRITTLDPKVIWCIGPAGRSDYFFELWKESLDGTTRSRLKEENTPDQEV